MRIFNRVVIGSDPWAGSLHAHLARWLRGEGYEVTEVNTPGGDPVAYYDVAYQVAERVLGQATAAGIVLCGTGMGVSMEANAVPGISCALCESPFTAERSRILNNANVLAMGEMLTTPLVAEAITRAFLTTKFGDGLPQELLEQIRGWHATIAQREKGAR